MKDISAKTVRHFTAVDFNDRGAWLYGFPLVIPQFALLVIAEVAQAGGSAVAFFLFDNKFVAFALLLGTIGVGGFLWLIRRHRLSWLACDQDLHRLCHRVRDRLEKIRSCTDKKHFATKAEMLYQETVQDIAAYFGRRLRANDIGCCIRIAEIFQGEQQYVTKGRSRQLDQRREDTTEAIPYNKWVAHVFSKQKPLGVFIINDINDAVVAEIWPNAKNNTQYDDVKTLMCSPINSVAADGKRSLMGILTVTSPRAIFQPAHTVPLSMLADLLGAILPLVYGSHVPKNDADPESAPDSKQKPTTDASLAQ